MGGLWALHWQGDTAVSASSRNLFDSSLGLCYQSFWTLSANRELLRSAALRAIAVRHAATPEQVFFAYVLSLGITPLTGTCSEQHMRDDLAAVTLALSEAERASIARLLEPG